jgi:hypothetical protein
MRREVFSLALALIGLVEFPNNGIHADAAQTAAQHR